MEYMKTVPDKYYELAIVDPPYGIGAGNVERGGTQRGKACTKSKVYEKKDWDSNAPDKPYFNELIRISKNQIIWGGNYFANNLNPSSCWIFWDKDNGENRYADGELAWTSFTTSVRKFKYRWAGMLQEKMGISKEERIHPTQKPVALYKWLLKNYAKTGDKIFDSHVGSGSSRIACYDMGFDFTGCELDKDYYWAQEARYDTHIMQGDLFSGSDLQEAILKEHI